MQVGEKVYVSDWGLYCSDFYRWVDGEKVSVFNWKTPLPSYPGKDHHIKREYEPILTAKGEPRKDGKRKLIGSVNSYESYEYEIREKTCFNNKEILLLSSTHTEHEWNKCFVQIGAEGVVPVIDLQKHLDKLEHLYKEKHLQALAVQNLGKWELSNAKDCPKELRKRLYDTDQRSQFGSTMARATIFYLYIPKELTKNGNDLCLGWEQSFDGGCKLDDKETISWNDMPKRFPEQKFNG